MARDLWFRSSPSFPHSATNQNAKSFHLIFLRTVLPVIDTCTLKLGI